MWDHRLQLVQPPLAAPPGEGAAGGGTKVVTASSQKKYGTLSVHAKKKQTGRMFWKEEY
jgi:hypothetical protein